MHGILRRFQSGSLRTRLPRHVPNHPFTQSDRSLGLNVVSSPGSRRPFKACQRHASPATAQRVFTEPSEPIAHPTNRPAPSPGDSQSPAPSLIDGASELDNIMGSLVELEHGLRPNQVTSWEAVLHSMRREHGDDGVWEVFKILRDRYHIIILADARASDFRRELVLASLPLDDRLEQILEVATTLSARKAFHWPNLYIDIVERLLSHGHYADAVFWHMRIASVFPPEAEQFEQLLVDYVSNPAPKLQSSLTTMYIFSRERRLYDRLIPMLYEAGQSTLAQAWRKVCLSSRDYPLTRQSQGFLEFLQRYYPGVDLHESETELFRSDNDSMIRDHEVARHKHNYLDNLVAKWFASSWAPIEFGINFISNLGTEALGPRSLQALAIREGNATDLEARIAQLRERGIHFGDRLYSNSILFFAQEGKNDLLETIIHCDVHPDEFDDVETRQMLLDNAIRKSDGRMQALMRAVEQLAYRDKHSSIQGSSPWDQFDEGKHHLADSSTSLVVHQIEASPTHVDQKMADRLLDQALLDISRNLDESQGPATSGCREAAIATALRLARQGAAIRLRRWDKLLCHLGSSGRLLDLEQLSLEIVELYDGRHGGLLPIHQADVPDLPGRGFDARAARAQLLKSGWDVLDKPDASIIREEVRRAKLKWVRQRNAPAVRRYFPADLPLSHAHHPLRQIFDGVMQSAIVRWWFQRSSLASMGVESGLKDNASGAPSQVDIGRGLRLLAIMRDRGVYIDEHKIRMVLIHLITLAKVPSRNHETRDRHVLSVEYFKRTLDEAWGSEILPPLPELLNKVEIMEFRLMRPHRDLPMIEGSWSADDQRKALWAEVQKALQHDIGEKSEMENS